MSISYIDGRYVRNLTEDTSQGAAKYENGDYTRAVVVGNYVQDGVAQSGALNGVPIEFMLDSINNQNIPVINILESHAAALAVLRSYGTNAHAYIPGVGVLNGLTAGNYTDTAGTQLTTKDQPVGLDLDAMGSLGAELVVNGGFGADTDWVKGSGWTIANGVAIATAAASGAFLNQIQTEFVSGRLYRLTYTVVSCSAGGFAARFEGLIGTARSTPGTYSEHFLATGATQNCGVRTSGTTTGSVDNVSMVEITGIHATQGTAGNKPVLRQGSVNMLLNSATLSTQSVAVAASPYTLSFTGTGTVTKSGTATGALVGTGATDRVTQTFTPTAGTLTLTVTGSVTSAQLQLGSTATTYVPTTSAKASAGTGPSYWEFGGDGSITDYLSTSTAPFDLSDDHWIVAAVMPNYDGTTNRRVLEILGTSKYIQLIVNNTTGFVNSKYYDGTTTVTSTLGAISAFGVANVFSVVTKSAINTVRHNGVSLTSKTVPIVGALTSMTIGSGGGGVFNGNMYALLLGKGTITDADLFLIEKLAASLAGITI